MNIFSTYVGLELFVSLLFAVLLSLHLVTILTSFSLVYMYVTFLAASTLVLITWRSHNQLKTLTTGSIVHTFWKVRPIDSVSAPSISRGWPKYPSLRITIRGRTHVVVTAIDIKVCEKKRK